jgi:hypothetical protein
VWLFGTGGRESRRPKQVNEYAVEAFNGFLIAIRWN